MASFFELNELSLIEYNLKRNLLLSAAQ